ncbi:hypothetical protein MMC31_003313 [Peltigera leucophlebia]|nr:hypothetical protein [Peltigera leucophlebia]
MGTAFVKKAYDDMQSLPVDIITYVAPDKFALRAFNRLAYNREISGPLVASYLLELLHYYTLSDNVKSINLAIVRQRFPEFALQIYKSRSAVDDFAIWYLCYLTLDDHVKYYATNVLQMRKSKINAYELAARNDHTGSSEENVIEQANPLEPNNAEVDNVDKQCFEMGLETHATVENLVTLTIYNWRSADATDSLAFPKASHMWNSIRHADDNGGSSALHRHFIQSNSDSGHIQGDMGLINNIDNETTILWQTITKASTSTTPDADAEVGDNVAGINDFVQLRPTQRDAEFFLTLSNDI